MNNINVRVVGTANVTQMSQAFGQVQGQVAALNAQLSQMVALQNGVDPRGFERMSRAASENSKMFRNAAASTGMFNVEQLKLNRATDDYVKRLNKQQMSFREMAKQRKVAAAAYKEQLAMENMIVRKNASGISHGKDILDVTYAKQASAELDTLNKQLAWNNAQLKSGAHQLVNWGKNVQWAGRQLMVGLTMPVAAFGAAAAVMSYQVDKELTRIAKVYDTTYDSMSRDVEEVKKAEMELAQVREDATNTAIKAARDYGSAGQDTLNVQAELAATGLKGAQLQEYTNEVMRISALGELDYQDSIQATISLQSVFQMSTQELTESFNYMNAVENATSLATKDFAAAIPIAAAPVKAFGGDIKELGVLLTAMKERGIEATQGANAIKAAMQRLGRPSAQVQEEWTALTGTDITKIFEDAGSLTELFQEIGAATADLDSKDRIKAFAGLFGTYQVTRMTAMVDGLNGVNDATSQVGAAMRIANSDAKDLANVADKELQRAAESISGKWDRAFQTMKLQLSTLGEPFLQIATVVVNGVSWIIQKFNELPGIMKTVIAGGIGLAAIAGPLVMLTGLFGNLAGMTLKGIAGLAGLAVKMKIVDKESRVAALASELAEQGFISEAAAVNQLTIELQQLAVAQAEANRLSGISIAAAGRSGTGPRPTSVPYTSMNLPMSPQAMQISKWYEDSEKSTAKIAENNKMSAKFIAGGAAGTAALATGMALTATNSEGLANDIGNMIILATVVVPAAVQLAPLMASAAKSAWSYSAAMASSAAGGLKNTLKSAGGIAGIARALPSMINPVGAAVAVVAAVGAGLYAWHRHVERTREEQIKLNEELNSGADAWAEAAGVAEKNWKGMTYAQKESINLSRQQEKYQQYSEGDSKEYADAFAEAGYGTDAGNLALQEHFIELQAKYGLSAKEASENIRALMAAAGYGLEKQEEAVNSLMQNLGEIKKADLGKYLQNQLDIFAQYDYEDQKEEWSLAGADAGRAFSLAFDTASSPEERQEILDSFVEAAGNKWNEAFATMAEDNSLTPVFEKLGIDSGDAFRRKVEEAGGIENFRTLFGETSQEMGNLIGGVSFAMLDKNLLAASDAEKEIITSLTGGTTALGTAIDDTVVSIDQLINSAAIAAGVLTYDDAVEQVKEIQTMMNNAPGAPMLGPLTEERNVMDEIFSQTYQINEEEKKRLVNQLNLNFGYAKGKTLTEAIANFMGKVTNETNAASVAAGGLANKLRLAEGEAAQLQRAGMQNIQDAIASAYRDDLAADHEAQMDAMTDDHERRQNGLDAAHERQQNAFEARWERRTTAAEKYWDKRIEGIDKAIEAEQKAEEQRKKMFDAEIARINKLNDMANTNIDFNVALNEGDLDEAARIRNNVVAEDAQSILERAANQGAGRSEKRIEGMEDKKENLEKQRDKYMDMLEKQEQAQQASLDRRQEAQSSHLDQVLENEKKTLEATQEAEEESLEQRLDMFLKYIATNERDLKRHMDDVGLSYKDFGRDVLKPMGKEWGDFYGEKLREGVRGAALALKSDKVWAEMGRETSKRILNGMGFLNMKEFGKFIETGEMPKRPQPGDDDFIGPVAETRHEGGEIGSGGGSRKGVAKNYKGLHPSERLVRAQVGEYMVNRDAAKKHAGLLHKINHGENIETDARPYHGRGKGDMGGEPLGMAGMVSGMLARGFMKGLATSMRNAKKQKKQEMAAQASYAGMGPMAPGTWGNYSLPGVKPWVLEAANWLGGKYNIGTILGVGQRSNYSEHPLGRALDFMVSDERGTQLANDVVNNAGILDAMYVIWRQRINSFDGRGWRPMEDRGSPTANHMDHVHVSFDPTGKVGDLPRPAAGGGAASYLSGPGGWHKPARTGSFINTHDVPMPVGSPVYAIGNGRIVESRYITSGGSPGNGQIAPNGQPYRSYGETMVLDVGGTRFRYAHLAPGSRRGLGPVTGGSQIARSGNTGNSSGPHLHMDVNGSYIASSWLASRGISLSKGAANVNFDNTIANLHKGEAVLTRDLNQKFHQGVENFANGGNSEYNITVQVNGTNATPEEIAREVQKVIQKDDKRKPQSRKFGS